MIRALVWIALLGLSAEAVVAQDDDMATEQASAARDLTDFTGSSADFGWAVVNDNVMGGRSLGGFEVVSGVLRFRGRTNTRGGGFSSIRSGRLALDLSSFHGVRVRVRGDGRRYTWRLTTDARYYGRPIAYWADFETTAGEWQYVDIPFSRFVPRFRGAELAGPSLDSGDITGMGLMIYDGADGEFSLELDRVQAFPEAPSFSLEQARWQHRVLVLSAPRESNPDLQAQIAAVAETPEAFDARDLLLVVLVDGGSSTVGGQRLSDEAATALRKQLRIPADGFAVRLVGKDGGVKLSERAVVSTQALYALIDRMPMRQREMTSKDP